MMKRLFTRQVQQFSSQQKDYYKVLGIDRSSSQADIKEAYRTLVKAHHPDVASHLSAQPDLRADRFQQIAEAYGVLGNLTAKRDYDFTAAPQADMLFSSAKSKVMGELKMADGHTAREEQSAYESEKREFIKREHKKYNVDAFGRVRGGVPVYRGGNRRGDAANQPGGFNYPDLHNLRINPNPDEQTVDSRDKMAYNRFTNEDKIAITRREHRPWFQAKVDYTYFNYDKPKASLRYFRNLMLVFFGVAMVGKTYLRRSNRSIIQKLRALKSRGEKAVRVAGERVFRSRNGTYHLQ